MRAEHPIITRVIRFILLLSLVSLLWLSLSNSEEVVIRWVLIGEWVVPMMLVIIGSFCAGWMFGLVSVLPSRLMLKRRLKHLLHLSRESV